MRTISEHKAMIIRNERYILDSINTILELKVYMLNKNLCPRCGKKMQNNISKMICYNCNMTLTDWEIDQIIVGKKGLIKKILNKKRTTK